jgi:cAMP phosphodiesterase
MIEVSFPNRLQGLAEITGHLTPKMAEAELKKLAIQGFQARAFHLKPNFLAELKSELAKTKPKIIPLEQGEVIEI